MKANKAFLAVLSLLLISLVVLATNKANIVIKATHVTNEHTITIADINQHEYIIVSGAGVIHSESCNCKTLNYE